MKFHVWNGLMMGELSQQAGQKVGYVFGVFMDANFSVRLQLFLTSSKESRQKTTKAKLLRNKHRVFFSRELPHCVGRLPAIPF